MPQIRMWVVWVTAIIVIVIALVFGLCERSQAATLKNPQPIGYLYEKGRSIAKAADGNDGLHLEWAFRMESRESLASPSDSYSLAVATVVENDDGTLSRYLFVHGGPAGSEYGWFITIHKTARGTGVREMYISDKQLADVISGKMMPTKRDPSGKEVFSERLKQVVFVRLPPDAALQATSSKKRDRYTMAVKRYLDAKERLVLKK